MSTERALVDTNVLVYAHMENAAVHDRCRELLDRAQAGDLSLVVAPQVFAEFYSTITDLRRVTKPYSPAEALEAIDDLLAMPGLDLLPVPTDVVHRWLELVQRHPVTGGAIFDVQLVATMLGNGVSRIYTYNRADFERFPEIEVLTP